MTTTTARPAISGLSLDHPGKHPVLVKRPPTVLVVEDDPALRNLMLALLEAEGFEAEAAGDGVEALEVMAHLQPALLLVDLMMPRMDGAELITTLRRRAAPGRTPPMVLLSAAPHLQQTANRLSVDYLSKPFDLEVLLDKIARHTDSVLAASHR